MKQHYSLLSWGLLLFLAGVWGSSFILMKKGLVAFSPYEVGALRMILSSVTLLPLMFFVARPKLRKVTKVEWRAILIAGVCGSGIPAFLFPLAETHISSASAGILNALTPIFVWILGISLFGLKSSRKQFLGVLIGFLGATILVLSSNPNLNMGDNLEYTSLVVIATFLYGLSANVIKKYLHSLDALSITTLTLSAAAVPYVVYLAISQQGHTWDTQTWTAFGYIFVLAVIGTALAMVLFNYLLKMTDPIFSSSVTYLIPIVALIWGLLDKESIFMPQILGMGIILLGVYLVNRKKK